MTSDEKDRINEAIGNLFEGLDVGDVAEIMAVQLAMLAAQGAAGLDEAVEFLNEIRNDAEDILDTVDFERSGDEDGNAEPPVPDGRA